MNSLLIIGLVIISIAILIGIVAGCVRFKEWYTGVIKEAEERGWKDHEYLYPSKRTNDNEPIY